MTVGNVAIHQYMSLRDAETDATHAPAGTGRQPALRWEQHRISQTSWRVGWGWTVKGRKNIRELEGERKKDEQQGTRVRSKSRAKEKRTQAGAVCAEDGWRACPSAEAVQADLGRSRVPPREKVSDRCARARNERPWRRTPVGARTSGELGRGAVQHALEGEGCYSGMFVRVASGICDTRHDDDKQLEAGMSARPLALACSFLQGTNFDLTEQEVQRMSGCGAAVSARRWERHRRASSRADCGLVNGFRRDAAWSDGYYESRPRGCNRAVDHEIREVALAREEVCGSARVKKNGEDPRAATRGVSVGEGAVLERIGRREQRRSPVIDRNQRVDGETSALSGGRLSGERGRHGVGVHSVPGVGHPERATSGIAKNLLEAVGDVVAGHSAIGASLAGLVQAVPPATGHPWWTCVLRVVPVRPNSVRRAYSAETSVVRPVQHCGLLWGLIGVTRMLLVRVPRSKGTDVIFSTGSMIYHDEKCGAGRVSARGDGERHRGASSRAGCWVGGMRPDQRRASSGAGPPGDRASRSTTGATCPSMQCISYCAARHPATKRMGRASIFSGLSSGRRRAMCRQGRQVRYGVCSWVSWQKHLRVRNRVDRTVVILPEVADLCSGVPSCSERGLWEGDADAAGSSVTAGFSRTDGGKWLTWGFFKFASGHIPTLHDNRSGVGALLPLDSESPASMIVSLAASALRPLWVNVLEPATAYTADALCALAERAVVRVLSGITAGRLTIHTPSRSYSFPSADADAPASGPCATLTVAHPLFWLRLALMGDLGFSEAYMYSEVHCDDLMLLFDLLLANRACLANLDSLLARLGRIPAQRACARLANSLLGSPRNISAHYDISNDMFEAFLSRDMTYSCAIWLDLEDRALRRTPSAVSASTSSSSSSSADSDAVKYTQTLAGAGAADAQTADEEQQEEELHEAQMRKLLRIIELADIRPGHRVLEIGSGWGSLALLVTSNVPGSTVDTLTLSAEQAVLAAARVDEAGLGRQTCAACAGAKADLKANGAGAHGARTRGGAKGSNANGDVKSSVTIGDAKSSNANGSAKGACGCREARVRVHYMDYRRMPAEWAGTFDRVVSVEMVEAVGQEWLESNAGRVLIRASGRRQTYWKQIEWALKGGSGAGVVQGITIPEAIFPGGFLPTLTLLVDALARGSCGRLVVERVENIGPHYARTLRVWRASFERAFEAEIVPALQTRYPDTMGEGVEGAEEAIEMFRRKWVYYFSYCEAGFASRSLGDHIVTFTREGNVDYQYGAYVRQLGGRYSEAEE
ncbi:predicted protein [Postia placenta Mad-698-R]|nr:predicted protein [Postia placenta Mad-698-R]